MKQYLIRLMILLIGVGILLAIPYFAGSWWWLFFSWLPAWFAMDYMENGKDSL